MSARDIEISATAAAAMRSAGAALVDVREPYEREAGYIDGSSHIELGELTARAAEIDSGRPVIFYCRAGVRSLMAAEAYAAAGYDAYSLAGGILSWVAGGAPIAPPGGFVAAH